jgi:hypothetical protein
MRRVVCAVPPFIAACGLSVVGVGSAVEPEILDAAAATDGARPNVTSDASQPDSAAVVCGGCQGFCVQGACKTPTFWVRGDDAVDATSFTWPDRSPGGNDAVQATAGLKPTILGTSVNGHKVLHFANDARLVVANANAFKPGTSDVVWFHVSRNLGGNSVDKNQVFGSLIDTDPWSGITAGYDSNDHPYGMFRANADVFIKSTTSSVNEVVVMDMRRTSGAAELRRNGASVAAGPANINVTGGQLVVGAERATGTEFFNGDIAEIVLFSTAFTDAEREGVAKQLGALYGVTVQ